MGPWGKRGREAGDWSSRPQAQNGSWGEGPPRLRGRPHEGPQGPPGWRPTRGPKPRRTEGGAGQGTPPQPQSGKTPSPTSSHSLFHSADQTQANGAAHTSERCRVRARAAAAKGAASRTSERCWVLAIVQQDTSRARGRSIINTRGRSYQIGGGGGGGGRRWRRRRKGGGDWGGREEEDLERARARG